MRIVHYINQFFAGIGGEEKADTPPQASKGPVGPGRLLQQVLGSKAEIIGTVICGDGIFADQLDQTADRVLELIRPFNPDAVVAGPAFNSGRYGLACGRVCLAVTRNMKIPAITGMFPENAAVEIYRRDVLIIPTSTTSAGMKEAIYNIARLVDKISRGASLGPAEEEGYLPRGHRMNVRVQESASSRALDLLLARMRKENFRSEVPLPVYETVAPPPPVKDPSRMRIALVTECGLVPKGNPGKLEWFRASRWLKHSIRGKDDLVAGEYEVVHGGYDARFANQDPDRLIPVDALRTLEKGREIGCLLDDYYVTCGNHAILGQMVQYAEEIASELKLREVDSVLLVAT